MTEPESRAGGDKHEQSKWHEGTRSQVLLFAVGVVLFILVAGLILYWYIDPQKATQRKDLAQALGLITAGVAGAVGILFTWRSQRLAREAQEAQEVNQRNTLEQLKQSRDELELNRRGQITERFTAAIDQLGKTDDDGTKNMEVRLGAIYSLERTAREDRDYHWPIIEVLTSYVRQHSPRILDETHQPPNGVHEQAPPLPAPDILAILTIIGRRAIYHKDAEYGPIDIQASNLKRSDLRGADLQQANLRDSDLWGADLREANLRGTSLIQCDLRGLYSHNPTFAKPYFKALILTLPTFRNATLGEHFSIWPSSREPTCVALTSRVLGN